MVTVTAGVIVALFIAFFVLAWLAGMIYLIGLFLIPAAAAHKVSKKNRKNP